MHRRARNGRAHRGEQRRHGTLRLEPLEPRVLLSAAEPTLELFSALPALFVENQGQWADASVRYLFQGSGASVAHTDGGPVFQIFQREPVEEAEGDPGIPDPFGQEEHFVTRATQFSVHFDGANAVDPVGRQPSGSVFNYCIGDQSKWRECVPGYEVVAYEGLYDGIDLLTWGRRDSLKYEFHVAPGADYRGIEVSYQGIETLYLDDTGALHIVTELGELVDKTPYIYQDIAGQRIEVTGRFELIERHTYGFILTGDYDASRELVIDPELAWSTYLGGDNDEFGRDIAVDGAGNVLVAGDTESVGWVSGGFGTDYNGGSSDAFVANLSSDGSHLWSTYLGGDSYDWGYGIATDNAGNVLVSGSTSSSGWVSGGFDTTRDLLQDGFVAKLTSDGAHLWSTYIDRASDIAVDGAGDVLVTGTTLSAGWVSGGFDTTYNDGIDGFVAKLSGDGAHLWSTYLGGEDDEMAESIAVDVAGDVVVTGYTDSEGWVSGGYSTFHHGLNDAFVVKLSGDGAHLWSTYLGSYSRDEGHAIATDGAGDVFVTGLTKSPGWVWGGFDTSRNGGLDAFVAKLSSEGAHVWSTYLGGDTCDNGYGIAVDRKGDVLITGKTDSSGWVSGGFDTSLDGYWDAFVAKLSGQGTHLWSTYLGGWDSDFANGIALDIADDALVTGYTHSSGWASGGFDTTMDGYYDAFAALVREPGPAVTHTPAGRAQAPVAAVQFTFRRRMDTESFSLAEDIVAFAGPAGPLTATGHAWLDDHTLEVTFEPQAEAGNYELVIGPNILDVAGMPLDLDSDAVRGEAFDDQYAALFRIEYPRVLSHTPRGFAFSSTAAIELSFSHPMDPTSFDPAADVVSFDGPDGPIAVTAHVWSDQQTLEITFDEQTAFGEYTMVISPQILDPIGRAMDQDNDFTTAEPLDDQYRATFALLPSGTVEGDVTLGPIDPPVILEDTVTVASGATLTIEAGSTIKFPASAGLVVEGVLDVRGTPEAPVIFTSRRDDAAGGDTNGDGSASTPSAGDWLGVAFAEHAVGLMDNVDVRYAATAVDADAWYAHVQLRNAVLRDGTFGVYVYSPYAEVEAENCLIANNAKTGVFVRADSRHVFRNCTVAGNGFQGTGWDGTGIHLGGATLTVENCIVAFNRNGLHHSGDPPLLTVRNSDFHNPDGQDIVWDGDPGMPDLGAGGNLTAAPGLAGRHAGNYELSGDSPCIDSGGGLHAPATDILGRARHDDLGRPNLGSGYPSYVDMGAFELQGNTEAPDLVVTGVSAPDPETLGVGDTVRLEWTVANMGTIEANGTWQDRVYLSDDPYLGDDLLLDTVDHSGPLPAGASYTGTIAATVPAAPGPKYVLVHTKVVGGGQREAVEANNVGVAPHVLAIDVPLLSVGTPVTGEVLDGNWDTYRIETEAGQPVLLGLDGDVGVCELYIRRGLPPTQSAYDVAGLATGPDQEARLLSGLSGTYYVAVYGRRGPTSYTLSADSAALGIRTVAPDRVGNAGHATIQVVGDGFTPDAEVQLVADGGAVYEGEEHYEDPSTLFATFDLAGAAVEPGAYDVTVTLPGPVSVTAPNAVVVEEGGTARLEGELVMPGLARPGRVITVRIKYTNPGIVDVPSPILTLDSGADDCSWKLPQCDTWIAGSDFSIMGLSSDGPATVLRPGHSESIDVQLRIPFRPANVHVVLTSVGATLSDGSQTAIDWGKFEAEVRPSDIDAGAWGPALAQLQAAIGSTWGEYADLLRQNAERFVRRGRRAYDVRTLLGLSLDKALGLPTAAVTGTLYSAATGRMLTGATVRARRTDGGWRGMGATSDSGVFIIGSLEPGTYELFVDDHYLEPAVTVGVSADSDIVGLSLEARPAVPDAVLEEPAVPREEAPSFTIGANGTAHLAWQRDGEIYHAFRDDESWKATGAIPGAEGFHPIIVAGETIADGSPGVLVVWETGAGNESELRYSVGEQVGGAFVWTVPALAGTADKANSNAAVALMGGQTPLLVWEKQDAEVSDDTDLYFQAGPLPPLSFAMDRAVPGAGRAVAAVDGSKYGVSVCFSRSGQLPSWIPLVGGTSRVDISAELTDTASDLCTFPPSGKGSIEVGLFNGRASAKGTVTGSGTWVVCPESCDWVFDSAELGLGASVSASIPVWAWSAGPVGSLELGAKVTGSLAGTLTWTGSNFPSWPAASDVALSLSLGPYGKAKLLGGALKGEVYGQGSVSATVNNRGIVFLGADITVHGHLKGLGIIKVWFERTWSWSAEAGMLALAAAQDGLEDLVFEVEPLTGTGNMYDGQTVLPDVSDDIRNDSDPAVAVNGGGEAVLAWAKDSADPQDWVGSEVMVSQWQDTSWYVPNAVPDSRGFNSGMQLVYASDETPLLIWSAASAAAITLDTPADDIVEAMGAGDIVYSTRSGGVWSAPASVATLDGHDHSPSVVRTDDGRVLVLWVHEVGDACDLLASTWDGQGWSAPETVSSGAAIASPCAGLAGGKPMALWVADAQADDEPDTVEPVLRCSVRDGAWSAAEGFADGCVPALSSTASAAAAFAGAPTGSSFPSIPDECCDGAKEAEGDPQPEGEEEDSDTTQVRTSQTPEDKFGVSGYDAPGASPGSEERYVRDSQTLDYRIEFWNREDAAVPTQDAIILDELDPALVDLSSLELMRIGFLDWDAELPGVRAIDTRIDCRPEMNIAVDVKAGLGMEIPGFAHNNDINENTLVWWFHTVDPQTGEWPEDPMAGFLPPYNPATGFEIGWVEFSVDPQPDLASGTAIPNQSYVEFDFAGDLFDHPAPKDEGENPSPWINTIDAGVPASNVLVLPAQMTAPEFLVEWSGTDDAGGSGIAAYDIYVATDGGAYELWLDDTTDTSATYPGEPFHTYVFYSIATDNVGHVEPPKAAAEATTQTILYTHVLTPGGKTGKWTFIDADGDPVTVILSGKVGTAEIVRAVDDDQAGDAISITLTGTDAKSTLKITSKGQTSIWDIIVHGDLKQLVAKTTALLGDLTVDDWLGKTILGDIAAQHVITLGGTPDDKPITFIASHIEDLTFASGAPVKSFTALDWLDTDATPDTLTAPSLGSLTTKGQKANAKKALAAIAGDFEASLDLDGPLGKAKVAGSVAKGTWTIAGTVGSILTGLDFCADLDALSVKSMSVKRNLDGATINLTQAVDPKLKALAKLAVTGWTRDTAITSAGHVAKFQTGGMDGSCLLLGVTGMDLPDDAADFKAQTLLKSFTVKGIKDGKLYQDSFIDSDVAAWCITKASLREVVTDNAGDPFGFAWCELKSLKWQDGSEKFKWPEKKPTDWPDDTGDFTVLEVV